MPPLVNAYLVNVNGEAGSPGTSQAWAKVPKLRHRPWKCGSPRKSRLCQV